MIEVNRRWMVALFAFFALFVVLPVKAEWALWWRTPAQAAKESFEQGEIERLHQLAPNAEWQALAHYRDGNYAAAATAFERRLREVEGSASSEALNRLRYNQGVNDVQAGRYAEALQHFEDVLDAVPDHADAAHNRDIAERLLQMQQTSSPSFEHAGEDPGSDANESEAGSQDDSESSALRSPAEGKDSIGNDRSADESGTGQRPQASETAVGDSKSQDSTDSDAQAGSSAASSPTPLDLQQQQAEAEAARQALAAEATQANESAPATETLAEAAEQRPLSEREQASEQLLRRIPDDPVGLLRRRLLYSHRLNYPEVRDAYKAW